MVFNSGIQTPPTQLENQMTFQPNKQFLNEPSLNSQLVMPVDHDDDELDYEERGVMGETKDKKKDRKKDKKKKSRSSSSSSDRSLIRSS
jgi:hypothetical protein